MKFLVLLLVLMIAYAVWRSGRRAGADGEPTSTAHQRPPRGATDVAPQDMVRCAVCALHLPRAEALAGRQGVYCGAEHLRQAEG